MAASLRATYLEERITFFRQLRAGKKGSMEAEDIVRICHQATTGEYTAVSENLVHAVYIWQLLMGFEIC